MMNVSGGYEEGNPSSHPALRNLTTFPSGKTFRINLSPFRIKPVVGGEIRKTNELN